MLTRTLLITGAILVSTLCITVTINAQLTKFNLIFQSKDFYNRGYPSAAPQVVRLNDRQFVIVDMGYGAKITVYNVDAQGKLTRPSDNDVQTSEVQPIERPTPRPTPTPIPTNTPLPTR